VKEFRPAKKRMEVSVGESVLISRELQELSWRSLSSLRVLAPACAASLASGKHPQGSQVVSFRIGHDAEKKPGLQA